jgi:hypothetical protein
MNNENSRNAFSQRHNHQSVVPITIRDEAPKLFREFLHNTMRHYLGRHEYHNDGSEFVFVSIGKVPRNSWRAARNEILNLPWYKVYDLLENFNEKVQGKSTEQAGHLRMLVNRFFDENGYAYKLSPNGRVEYRGEESFESSLRIANQVLAESSLLTARDEIHKAIEDLSRRPKPDLSGAVQHAMAGLECAAKKVTDEPSLELGKVLKKHPTLFPPPLDEVLSKLYGFASNNGRHLVEGGEPTLPEAELIVGIAAASATYLARKN